MADVVREELQGLTPLELRPETLRQYSNIGVLELGEHGENFAALAWRIIGQAGWVNEHLQLEEIDSIEPENRDALSALETITAWLSELTPHAIKGITTLSAPTGEVIFAVQEDPFGQPLSARSLSDGTLRFAALSFALFGSGAEGRSS